jgi:hypothetical protein
MVIPAAAAILFPCVLNNGALGFGDRDLGVPKGDDLGDSERSTKA